MMANSDFWVQVFQILTSLAITTSFKDGRAYSVCTNVDFLNQNSWRAIIKVVTVSFVLSDYIVFGALENPWAWLSMDKKSINLLAKTLFCNVPILVVLST